MNPRDVLVAVIVVLSEIVSVILIVRLWRRGWISLARKIVWTLALLIPVLGPLLYAGLFGGRPPTQADSDKAGVTVSGTELGG